MGYGHISNVSKVSSGFRFDLINNVSLTGFLVIRLQALLKLLVAMIQSLSLVKRSELVVWSTHVAIVSSVAATKNNTVSTATCLLTAVVLSILIVRNTHLKVEQ